MRIAIPSRIIAAALAVAVAPGLLRAESTPDHPLTVEAAVALALEKNERIIVERASVASASEAVTGAKGAYDPVFELTGDWRNTTVPVNSSFSGAPAGKSAPTERILETGASIEQLLPTGGVVTARAHAARNTTNGAFSLLSPAYGTQVGVELRQPLLRDRAFDTARFALRVASSELTRTGASLRSEITDMVVAVERAYWKLVATRREVSVREEAVRLADEQVSETGSRIESGEAPETEASQPRSELERRRGELFAAREAAARAESALKLLILGADDAAWSEHFAPEDDPSLPVAPVDVAKSMEQALASRPELVAAGAVVERRRAETELARNAVRPTLDAVVSYDKFGFAGSPNPAGTDPSGLPAQIPPGMEGTWTRSFDMLSEGRFSDARAGVLFRIPIGNRSLRAVAAIAQNVTRQAEADLAGVRKAIRAEVLDAAAALDTGSQRIEAARAARAAADVQLTSEQERYHAGLSTNFLVLTRQNELSQARLNEISALTDYRAARIAMARAQASLLEERGIEVDERTR